MLKDRQRREFRHIIEILYQHHQKDTLTDLLSASMSSVLEKELPPLYHAIRNEATCIDVFQEDAEPILSRPRSESKPKRTLSKAFQRFGYPFRAASKSAQVRVP